MNVGDIVDRKSRDLVSRGQNGADEWNEQYGLTQQDATREESGNRETMIILYWRCCHNANYKPMGWLSFGQK